MYERLPQKKVRCRLCAHGCTITDGGLGFCGVRRNKAGRLYALSYGNPVALHVDPIEKKPLYHFMPGSLSYSLAAAGCNFRCGFCQNREISQARLSDRIEEPAASVPAEKLVKDALCSGVRSVSFTYTEPTVFLEYALDIASLSKRHGLCNVFVTNGFMSAEALRMVKPVLDAANVDLKFFRDEAYRKICRGRLAPVLDSIRLMKELGIWVEITTLVIPGENDSDEELRDIARFIAGIDVNIPWHLSRFYPVFRYTGCHATPGETLHKAVEIGRRAGLRYLYAGNVTGWGNETRCFHCGELLIRRDGYRVRENRIVAGRCRSCRSALAGVFV
ncbi:MAG: AmmeMemoRadiSam system radical SAM enzyme [Candidatus Omnitrophica bacterium]|nr:AmmeMemoRadiSam system radical SAM enzyme [Candidatus Omnitrophota bacterium]